MPHPNQITRPTGLRRNTLFALTLALATLSPAALAQTFCVYDPMGTAGDYFSLFKDYQIAAKRWGVSIDMVPYTDDDKLIEAYDNGHCDMASMIGFRARSYNQFTGSIDSPGTIVNYSEMRDVLKLMTSDKVEKYMVSGNNEVVGVLPVGAGYAVVNTRDINGVAKTAGHRAAVPRWDKSQLLVTSAIKTVPVPLDFPQFGKKFADGSVDIIVIPMALYKPMEIDKSIAKYNGGIIRRPLFQFTMQVVTHKDKFPPDFGHQSRAFVGQLTDHALGIARNVENEIDPRNWLYAQHSEVAVWSNTMNAVCEREAQQGFLDRRMLSVLRRIHCRDTPDDASCEGAGAATAAAPLN